MSAPVNFFDERLPPEFWAKVQPCPMSGCWIWTGATKDPEGYGVFKAPKSEEPNRNRRTRRAHRYAYQKLITEPTSGLDLDHLCRVRSCVNPTHLEQVTRRENLLRGQTSTARNAAATHCPQGHEYNEQNTDRWEGRRGTKRRCKACQPIYNARKRDR